MTIQVILVVPYFSEVAPFLTVWLFGIENTSFLDLCTPKPTYGWLWSFLYLSFSLLQKAERDQEVNVVCRYFQFNYFCIYHMNSLLQVGVFAVELSIGLLVCTKPSYNVVELSIGCLL